MKNFFLFLFWITFNGSFAQNHMFDNLTFVSGKSELNYRYFKPKNSSTKLPLILFLHGSGERGIDNEKHLKHIAHLASEEFQNKFPCYILAPQCPAGVKWVNVEWTLKSHIMPPITPTLQTTIELLKKIILKDPIDTDRIYVVGLSMGGFGTWDILCREPKLFAAGVPICGGGDETKAHLIKDIPIWAFHGALDKVVLPSRSQNMVNAIEKLNGKARLTIYPDIAHAAWEKALHSDELWLWLFEQSKTH
jgi:predicted peptidase